MSLIKKIISIALKILLVPVLMLVSIYLFKVNSPENAEANLVVTKRWVEGYAFSIESDVQYNSRKRRDRLYDGIFVFLESSTSREFFVSCIRKQRGQTCANTLPIGWSSSRRTPVRILLKEYFNKDGSKHKRPLALEVEFNENAPAYPADKTNSKELAAKNKVWMSEWLLYNK